MTSNQTHHILAERGRGALNGMAIAAAIAIVAGGCAAAWFAYRRARSRHEELSGLTRWEDEGGAPA